MVKDLLKKSEPTIDRAVATEPEKRREVTNVTLPAMIRHMKALTADLAVVSVKEPVPEVSAIAWPFKYSFFFDWIASSDSSNLERVSIACSLCLSIFASFFSSFCRNLSDKSPSSLAAAVLAPRFRIGRTVGRYFIGVVKAETADKLANSATAMNFLVEGTIFQNLGVVVNTGAK